MEVTNEQFFKFRLHNTTGCQTGLTTSCIVHRAGYTESVCHVNMWQQWASCDKLSAVILCLLTTIIIETTRMWADTQHDSRLAEYRWHPLQKFRNSIPCTTQQSLAARLLLE